MASHVVTPSSQIPDFFDFSAFLNTTTPSSSTEIQAVPESLHNDSAVFTEADALALLDELNSYCQQFSPPESSASLAPPTERASLPSTEPLVGRLEHPGPSRCEATPRTGITVTAQITQVKQRIPKPVKWFPCQFPGCTKKFNRFGLLLRHEGSRAHMGLKPFECHCGQRFSRSDNWGPHRDSCHRDEDVANEATKRRFDLIHQDINRRNELRKKEMTLQADLMVKNDDSSNPACAPQGRGDAVSVAVPEVHANTSVSGSAAIPVHNLIAALPWAVDHLASRTSYPSVPSCAQSTPAWNPSVSACSNSLASLDSTSPGIRLQSFSSTWRPQDPLPYVPRLPPGFQDFPPAPTSRSHYGFMPFGGTNPAFPYGTLASPVSLASTTPVCGPRDFSGNIATAPLESNVHSWPAPSLALRSSRQTNLWSHSSSVDGDGKQTPEYMRCGVQGVHPMVGLSTNSVPKPHHPASLLPQSPRIERPAMADTQLRYNHPQLSSHWGLPDENIAPRSGDIHLGTLFNSTVGTFPSRVSKRNQDSMQGSDSFTDGLPLKRMAWEKLN